MSVAAPSTDVRCHRRRHSGVAFGVALVLASCYTMVAAAEWPSTGSPAVDRIRRTSPLVSATRAPGLPAAPPVTTAVAARRPVVAAGRSAAPPVAPATPAPAAATAADYTLWFAGQGAGGGPARWDPCRTISVSGGPALTVIVATELSLITGLRLQPVPSGGDILITSAPTPGVLAVTRDSTVGGWIVHADVTLSPEAAPRLTTILRHELGHALGLAHSQLPSEVMTPGTTVTRYSADDIAGLRQLGTAAGPCQSGPGSPAVPGVAGPVTGALGWPAVPGVAGPVTGALGWRVAAGGLVCRLG